MHHAKISVNELLKAAEQGGTFTPKKGSKSMGTIAVDQCKITGAGSPQTTPTVNHTPTVNTAPDTLPMPVPVPVSQMGNMSLTSGQKPTFVDYVSGNCDLGLVRTQNYI